ncbi:MAG TPA: glutamate-1-semialdehyde 2,1-aminomutase [Elusimicrobiota bacterium]|nr:glutamate-1-semialdehyde 2,1-aminomutase [Elusimicrobiota bacterium]
MARKLTKGPGTKLTKRRVDQKALFARARKSLVGGVNSPVRAFKSVGGSPVFVESGSGAYLTTADGRKLVDFCLSWGPLMFGHARRELVAAATRALSRGTTFGAATMAEVSLAERIKIAFPSMELLRMTSSGTEADMSALRAARAFTKRDLVIKFAGCYHGHVDSLLVAAGSGATTLGVPDSAGVPSAMAATTVVVPFNDLPAVESAFKKNKGRIAAVIVEPLPANMGVVFPNPGFLEGLRGIATREKSLLIFDEVITGFRVCYGGVQTRLKIKPDLTILGKIVGGGLPLAVYGGRRDVMSMIAPEGPAYQAGTLSGNPVAVAAGTAMLDLLRAESPYRALEQYKGFLCEGFRQAADAAGVPVRIQSSASMFTLFFREGAVTDYASALKADKAAYGRFFHAMLKRGVYLPPAQWEAAFVSTAHGGRELELAVKAAREAFRAV